MFKSSKILVLEQYLDDVVSAAVSRGGDSSVDEAALAALQLKAVVGRAVNPRTGKIDCVRLNNAYRMYGTSIEYYRQKLNAVQPEGGRAITQMCHCVLDADMPF